MNCTAQYQDTEIQYGDWHPTGDESDRGYPHMLQRRLKGMGDGDRYTLQRGDRHRLSRGGIVSGLRREKLQAKCGKFHNHGRVEVLVRCQFIHAP